MTDTDLQALLALVLEKANLILLEVRPLQQRMKALERWQITMDTILKNMHGSR